MSKKEFIRIFGQVLDWAEVVANSVLVIILLFSFIISSVIVDGNSMNCTLYNNDIVLVTNMAYTPKINDIVVANSDFLNKTVVKRVIATEGQTVEIDYKNNTVKVDGNLISENEYLKEKIMYDNEKFDSRYFDAESEKYTYIVPKDSVFLMGDNRNHSTDSRVFGCVDVKCIVGKVFFRLFSSYGELGFM